MFSRRGLARASLAVAMAVCVPALALVHGSRRPQLHRYEASRMSMACLYVIEAYGPDAAALPRVLDEAFDEVDRIDRLMSHYKPDSPLSRLNREARGGPVPVERELFDFIAEALRYSRESDGAFDVTVGPLMKAWGFFRGDGRVPSDAELDAARRGVGARRVKLNPASRTIAFDDPHVELDLGGIAKGYAVDRVVELLKRRGVTAALVSAGGSSIYALGAPPHRDAWTVAIQDPVDVSRTAFVVQLRDRALSVAGRSEKSFEAGGTTYSHIVDPRSGRPVQGILSVAVLSAGATAGDALDDALFVLGPKGSQGYLRRLPGVDAYFFLPGPNRTWSVEQAPVAQPDFELASFAPKRHIVYRAAPPLVIDGKLDEASWNAAPWTDTFVDIEGDVRPRPTLRTRAKMLWNDEYFYVAAEMEEPDLWATLRQRDSVIFHDNDFEVFVDPDGDTHAYYELEVNALGTPWDLMLIKPYRDGGRAIDGWDIAGLKVGIDLRGTINRPGDKDGGWSVELALPWRILREAAPGNRAPKAGEQWRVNCSRVQWQVSVVNGAYTKVLKPNSKDPLPESNWVWSPQGAVNMHLPERWGYVQFSSKSAGSGTDAFVEDPNEKVKWALRRVYYRQRALRAKTGSYTSSLEALQVADITVDGLEFTPVLYATPSLYEVVAPGFEKSVVHIDQDGRVWVTR